MKKLLVCVALAAFVISVQAGDNGTCSEKSGSCCGAKKASLEAKAECPMAKQAKANGKKTMHQASAKVLKSPKATG